ncbi:MAG TPA: FtsQ-type POTRA domain-containing protein [Patescibacteria group bacterium]|nr:FtsQ-type POTRA domain-containing protein [Patescibacteria group bacterium]
MPPKKSLILLYHRNKSKLVFLVIFIVFFALFYIVARLFSVTHISLSGSDSINGLDQLSQKNIFFISISATEKNLYTANPYLQSVKIIKQYPDSLHIIVQKALPTVQLVVDGGFFLLANDGRIIAKQRTKIPDISTVNYYQQLHFNEYEIGALLSKKDILFNVFFVHNFTKMGITVDTVDIINLNMIVLNTKDKTYLFTADKEKEVQFEAFQRIYTYMNVEGIEYKSLDMRFEKPIIKI